MSSSVTGLVWDHFPEGGGPLLTALCLADHADPDGTNIFPSLGRIAMDTRQSKRTVQNHIEKMLEMNWLLVTEQGVGRGHFTKYRIPVDYIPQAVLGTRQKLLCLEPQPLENMAEKVATTWQKGSRKGAKQASRSTGTSTSTLDQERTPLRGARAPKIDVPADFKISDAVRTWAEQQAHGQLDEQLAAFVRKARKGGYRYVDLDEALMDAIAEDWAGVRGKGAAPAAGAAPTDWWDSATGIEERRVELGVPPGNEYRVLCHIAALTPGDSWPWIDPRNATQARIIREIRGEIERGEA